MHLGDLIQISISYTKELRKHFMKHFTRRFKQNESKRSAFNQLSTSNSLTFNEITTPQVNLIEYNFIEKKSKDSK
jgi:hypothetical protein